MLHKSTITFICTFICFIIAGHIGLQCEKIINDLYVGVGMFGISFSSLMASSYYIIWS